jgi:serine/threonine protein phosphatase PrpC
MKSLALRVAQRTAIGSRSRNEDCAAVEYFRGHWCLVLSDGAAGHGNGRLAAQLVVERVLTGFRSRPPVDARDLSELLLDAHDAVVAGQREMGANNTKLAMHATVVMLLIDTSKSVALWGHVGDSRLYLWRNGRLNTVTRDDSVLQSVLDTGLVDSARMSKLRNRGVLLAALGAAEEAVPHVSGPFELQGSDAFLLCSDGWWGGLDSQIISRALANAASPEEWLDAMVDLMLQHADPRQDNYTAIACWVDESVEAGQAATEARTGTATEAETLPPQSQRGHAHHRQ